MVSSRSFLCTANYDVNTRQKLLQHSRVFLRHWTSNTVGKGGLVFIQSSASEESRRTSMFGQKSSTLGIESRGNICYRVSPFSNFSFALECQLMLYDQIHYPSDPWRSQSCDRQGLCKRREHADVSYLLFSGRGKFFSDDDLKSLLSLFFRLSAFYGNYLCGLASCQLPPFVDLGSRDLASRITVAAA